MSTLLIHAGDCGGSVVLDMSSHFRLIAPSFAFNKDGITSFTLDVRQTYSSNSPELRCVKCGYAIIDMENELMSTCLICGISYPVKDLRVHSQLACTCINCIDALHSIVSGKKGKVKLTEYVQLFGLKKDMNFIPMSDMLKLPIKI